MKGLFVIPFACVLALVQPGHALLDAMSNATDVIELQCLRDLPVDHLLKIRRALQLLTAENEAAMTSENRVGIPFGEPQAAVDIGQAFNRSDIRAMPLIGSPFKKMGWEPWAEEKPTKIQKIFQVSITALSFLAFGGYLLCMIVQAIKSKGTTYYYPSIQTTRKRRPILRERRDAFKGKQNDDIEDDDNNQAGPSPDDLYRVLLMAAEGYVRLKQS